MERYNGGRLPGSHNTRRQVPATPMQIDGAVAVAVVKRSSRRVRRLERPMAQLQLHQAEAEMEADAVAEAVAQETEAHVKHLQLPSMPVLQDSDVEINERHRHKHKSKSKSKSKSKEKEKKERKEKKAKKHEKKKLRQLLREEQAQVEGQEEGLLMKSTEECEGSKIGDISAVRWVNQKKRILEQWQREHGRKKHRSKKHHKDKDNNKCADKKKDRK